MAKYIHLSRAPITEALIDIRIAPAKAKEVGFLEGLTAALKEAYPEKNEIRELRYQLKLGDSVSENSETKHLGYKYTSKDGRYVVQATLTGLTLSRLAPYEDWHRLRDEAWKVWRIYADLVQLMDITRVATRFINRLDLPGPSLDLNDYLNYVPVVPKVLPQSLTGFFSRIAVPDEKRGFVAMVTQSFQPGQSASAIPVLLDIDVFREKPFGSEEEAWATIDQFREVKDMIFFDSITERVVELYK